MDTIKKAYVVWYWDSLDFRFRMGQTFKTKFAAEKFIEELPKWKYIATTYNYTICSDEVA